MSKGFLVLAQNTDTVNYVKQAYALALSIKFSQQGCKSISLITNDPVPKKYQRVFDQIIPIPWTDDAKDASWKVENRWKFYHVTPYEETIVLDTDMLLLDDISDWWEYLGHREISFCSKIKNYKLETIEQDHFHRKAFIVNNLTNPYFALHYFKKTDTSYNFYKALEFISYNWELCYTEFAPKEYQNWLSMDLAAAIAIEMLGLHGQAIDVCSPLEFVHMKIPLQKWSPMPVHWPDVVEYYFNKDRRLIVGNIKQPKLFHYVEKDFISKKLLTQLEEFARG